MFVDAQEMHKKHPDSFYAPTIRELRALKKGDTVKVCYNNLERFWVILTSVKGNKLEGKVDNHVLANDLSLGDIVSFERRHVYDIF